MRRVFWLAAGLGAGVTAAFVVSRWMRRQTRSLAPANIGRQAGQLAKDAGSLVTDAAREFRRGMDEKEREIRSSLPE